jgi:hypothetical protein
MAMAQSAKQRLAYLLSNGVQQNVAAASVGISTGRLSQILETDLELRELMIAEAAKDVDKSILRDGNLRTIENRLLRRMPDLVDECTSLGEGVRALQVLADMRAKARGIAPSGSTGIGAAVQLNLSGVANAQINVVLNAKSSILAIGGQSVQPMSRGNVEEFFNGYDESGQQVERYCTDAADEEEY